MRVYYSMIYSKCIIKMVGILNLFTNNATRESYIWTFLCFNKYLNKFGSGSELELF
jgi:hypothetical protein